MNRIWRAWPVLLLCTASAQAQLYKWTGPDGKVTYGDAPPSSAARIESRPAPSGTAAGSDLALPYELAQAAKRHPVTLYTTTDCAACDEGRNLLSARGIPFAEKTVTTRDDAAQLRQFGDAGKLPLLAVGRVHESGFEAGAWNSALTAAGYPETSKLPKGYRQPPAVAAAAPAPKPPAATAARQPKPDSSRTTAPPAPTDVPPAAGNAPPGFRF